MEKMEHEPKYRDAGYYSPEGGTSDKEAKSFGDFVQAVYRNDTLRLNKVYKSDMAETSGAAGGYLVPEEFHNQLIEAAPPEVPFRERAMVIPVGSDAGKVPALDQQTTVTAGSGNTSFSGGVDGGWVAEGAAGASRSHPQNGVSGQQLHLGNPGPSPAGILLHCAQPGRRVVDRYRKHGRTARCAAAAPQHRRSVLHAVCLQR